MILSANKFRIVHAPYGESSSILAGSQSRAPQSSKGKNKKRGKMAYDNVRRGICLVKMVYAAMKAFPTKIKLIGKIDQVA